MGLKEIIIRVALIGYAPFVYYILLFISVANQSSFLSFLTVIIPCYMVYKAVMPWKVRGHMTVGDLIDFWKNIGK